ncbi:hypothetical protein M440DRAFT_1251471 [Trichoderma longibrachiatum ATCC 18648]|uniref:Uncharacterized protein n=1 Tax=Trichoderma longibrachiatum ATCC 18648 TaxID=983965 RepID=A0A2T4C491_TRILO|nr:hypothetical protein M440DRAFT_1251471 [Trichoderma longibrachiatum ATCC 18648]
MESNLGELLASSTSSSGLKPSLDPPFPAPVGRSEGSTKRKHHTLATRLPISQPLVSPVSARHRLKSGRIPPIRHADPRKVLIPLRHRSMRCRCSTEDDHQTLILCAGHDSSSQAVVYSDK